MGRLGSTDNPLRLSVQSQEEAVTLMAMCETKGWKTIVRIAEDEPADLEDLEKKLHPESSAKAINLPGRNESCHCGSGKKYKKCCLQNDALLH